MSRVASVRGPLSFSSLFLPRGPTLLTPEGLVSSSLGGDEWFVIDPPETSTCLHPGRLRPVRRRDVLLRSELRTECGVCRSPVLPSKVFYCPVSIWVLLCKESCFRKGYTSPTFPTRNTTGGPPALPSPLWNVPSAGSSLTRSVDLPSHP